MKRFILILSFSEIITVLQGCWRKIVFQMENLDRPVEKGQISSSELFTLFFYINGEEGGWAKTIPCTAHVPTPFSLLINLSCLALSKTDQLQSLAISVDYFVVRRNCKSCCLLTLCKSLLQYGKHQYFSKWLPVFYVPLHLPGLSWLPGFLTESSSVCVFLHSAPWVNREMFILQF